MLFIDHKKSDEDALTLLYLTIPRRNTNNEMERQSQKEKDKGQIEVGHYDRSESQKAKTRGENE